LREIYLAGYEIAVKGAQPWSLMCSYNKINGTYASEHKKLMHDVLKEEWGHEGLVVTDWGAMNERVPGLKAGVELEMPGTDNGNDAQIVAAVKSGELEEIVLDRVVERILALIFKAVPALAEDYVYDVEAHHQLARRVAGEGAVLLKNEGGLLPLKEGTKVALIGRFAKTPRYQGAGSSLMNPTRLDNIYDEIVKSVGAENMVYADGYTEKSDVADEVLIAEALQAASGAEVVVICAGLIDVYQTEGVDRQDMKMPPGQDALIEQLVAIHGRIVVVLSNGSPVEMPWVDAVQSILEGYLGGQAGAGAIADILYGRVNPSGKLAETFPLRLEDTSCYANFPGGPVTVEYRESIYVGYRYYDTVGQDVLFPFGHGLSYTRFDYRDLNLTVDGDSVAVRLKVRNAGDMAGKETIQVYVHDTESTAFRPAKELKGFTKIYLEPGEETEVSIALDRRAFAYYDVAQRDWGIEAGEFEVLVGASSRDIRLTGKVQMVSEQQASLVDREKLAVYYDFPQERPVRQAEFESLLGHPVPPNLMPQKGSYTLNTPVCDMQESFIGRQVYKMVEKQLQQMNQGKEDTPMAQLMIAIIREMPLRTMLMMGDGTLNREQLEALLMMINGRFFKGLGAFLKGGKSK